MAVMLTMSQWLSWQWTDGDIDEATLHWGLFMPEQAFNRD